MTDCWYNEDGTLSVIRLKLERGDIMAFRDPILQSMDAQVRRINTQLRQAASVFGTESIQYKERAEAIVKGFDVQGDASMLRYDANGVLQIARTRDALTVAATGAAYMGIHRVETMATVSEEKKKLLQYHIDRTGQDPAQVDKSVQGRQARAQKRKQQIEQAIKEEANRFGQLQSDIIRYLGQLYAIERDYLQGRYTDAHVFAREASQGRYTDEATLREILEKVKNELEKKGHKVTSAFEQGFKSTIKGAGGLETI